MIRRLVLKDWRNYDNVTINFDEGTTFVVAANGIGKTSLVEAARFALFGTLAFPPGAVRSGSMAAVATVDLELPSGRLVTVRRQLMPSKAVKRVPLPDPEVDMDGTSITSDEFAEVLVAEYGAEPSFLARLTMPPADAADDAPSSLGLEEHLGRFYGVHSLRAAADELTRRGKLLEKRIASVKTANAASAKQLDALRQTVRSSETRVDQALKAHENGKARLELAERGRAALAEADAWDAAESRRAAQLQQLAQAFVQTTHETIAADGGLAEAVDNSVEERQKVLSRIDVRIGVLEATIVALRTNLERLNETHRAHEDCPVCRRPLDDATAQNAASAATAELSEMANEATELRGRRESMASVYGTLLQVQRQIREVRSLPPRPEAPTGALTDDVVDAIRAAQVEAFDELVAARGELQVAQQTLERAEEADEAMRELVGLFAKQARLTVALEATQATLREILSEAVSPLASAVNERWTELFPDRGVLRTSSDGVVTRTVNGHPLPFSAFSAGEGAGLNLLVRLVVASMATSANFCWFDEPLEHMDPDTRRYVASMLARAGSGDGALRQVVLTTYEETLARHLQSRDPRFVHLRDVRQAPATEAATA